MFPYIDEAAIGATAGRTAPYYWNRGHQITSMLGLSTAAARRSISRHWPGVAALVLSVGLSTACDLSLGPELSFGDKVTGPFEGDELVGTWDNSQQGQGSETLVLYGSQRFDMRDTTRVLSGRFYVTDGLLRMTFSICDDCQDWPTARFGYTVQRHRSSGAP